MKTILSTILCFLVFWSYTALTDERIRPAQVLLAEGYLPATNFSPMDQSHQFFQDLLPIGALSWPVQFQDFQHSIANSMTQYQPFDKPGYFHGGCDLRVKLNEKVFAPIAGRIEAGHYSYTNNSDGSLTKFWIPWPKAGEAVYFEVSVIDEQGNRFEMHHMDEKRLSKEVLTILQNGVGKISAGTYLGDAVFFSNDYHHIHYNVIGPDGTRFNPESLSLPLPDHLAPVIKGVFAKMASSAIEIKEGAQLKSIPNEIVVWTVDRLDQNLYDQPPVLSQIDFESGERVKWDFHRTLTDGAGKFPNLFQFILQSLNVGGKTYRTEGGFGIGSSLFRLQVPQSAKGKFTITVGDLSGNTAQFKGSMP